MSRTAWTKISMPSGIGCWNGKRSFAPTSGAPIEPMRLDSLPSAVRCIECQQRFEAASRGLRQASPQPAKRRVPEPSAAKS